MLHWLTYLCLCAELPSGDYIVGQGVGARRTNEQRREIQTLIFILCPRHCQTMPNNTTCYDEQWPPSGATLPLRVGLWAGSL